jgi:hypothetical protein
LKENFVDELDVEFGKELIVVLPGAKEDIKYNGNYQTISASMDLGLASGFS